MKTIYFTVTKKLEDIDGTEIATGIKEISLYEIENNKPEGIGYLE